MNIVGTPLSGLLLIELKVFGGDRGFFLELYRQPRYVGLSGRMDRLDARGFASWLIGLR